MKRLRIMGLALLALFALGAFAASAASAEEGVLPPTNFTAEGGEGELVTLNNETIKCKEVKVLEGVFLAEKEKDQHGTADLHFIGCKAAGLLPANTLGDTKEVILAKVLFLICLIKELVFGILILPLETVHIEVPSVSSLILVNGDVIAELEGAGLAGKEFKFNLVGKGGDQTTALKCTINGKEFKHTLEAALDSEADSMASEKALFTVKFEKAVELMDT